MTTKNLREIVHEALDNAVANGYPPSDDVDENVRDLQDMCADVEDVDTAEVEIYVKEWLARRGSHAPPL